MSIFKVLIKPREYLGNIFSDKKSGWQYFFVYGFTFALIGPVLSFYSLTYQLSYSPDRTILYSLTTYFMDLLIVIIFSFLLSVLFGVKFEKILKFYVVVNIPVWIGDIFDIYQPLRILSNLGFIYSFYILWIGIKILNLRKQAVFIIGLHLILYVLNALLSEMIATNPLLLKILKSI